MASRIILAVLLLSASLFCDEKRINFPEQNPLISIVVEDSWHLNYIPEHKLLEIDMNVDNLYYDIHAFEASSLEEAFEQAGEIFNMEFYDAKLGTPEEEDIHGIKTYKFSGSELNFENFYYQYSLRLLKINDSNYVVVFYVGSSEDIEEYEWDLEGATYTIKPITD